MLTFENTILPIVTGIISAWVFTLVLGHRMDSTRAVIDRWFGNIVSSLRIGFPRWYRSFIEKKYGLNTPGKFVVDQYCKGSAPDTFLPLMPLYLSEANTSVLLEALRYSAGNPKRLSLVSDFVIEVSKYGVFPDTKTANKFLDEVRKDGIFPQYKMGLRQPVWSSLSNEERSAVTVPEDEVQRLLTNIATWFAVSRLAVFIVMTVIFLFLAN